MPSPLLNIVDSGDILNSSISNRVEISLENNSDCKMDSKKNIFLVQLFTNPREFSLNFKSGTIVKKIEEMEESGSEESEQSEINTWVDILKCVKRSISNIGYAISEVVKTMFWFKNKNELLSFIVYSKDKNPINFAQLNLFFLVFFIFDLLLCSFIPSFLHSDDWGKGMEWNAHRIMGSYFVLTILIEYIYVQYLYSKIWQPKKWYRFFNPIKPWIFSMLSKMDVYTDFCMTVEIYKCQSESKENDYFLFLFIFSFTVFWVSIIYQVWWFIRMIIGRQPKSTFDPLYSNTSSLAYSASFKCLGEFIDRFWIPYYGHLSDYFNAKKALAFIKLIVEDCLQCMIQILFLLRRNSNDGVYYQLWISLTLSGLSALTSIAVIFGDATSPLSNEDQASLGKFIKLRFLYLMKNSSRIQASPTQDSWQCKCTRGYWNPSELLINIESALLLNNHIPYIPKVRDMIIQFFNVIL